MYVIRELTSMSPILWVKLQFVSNIIVVDKFIEN